MLCHVSDLLCICKVGGLAIADVTNPKYVQELFEAL